MLTTPSADSNNQSGSSTTRINRFLGTDSNDKFVREQGGEYNYRYDSNENCIWLNSVKSGNPRSGFGTTVIRTMIEESQRRNCPGKIKLQAAWSAHIFHLLMGFIPEDRDISYLVHNYGLGGPYVIQHIVNEKIFNDDDDDMLDEVCRILRREQKIPKNQKTITAAEAMLHKDFLLGLKDKRASFLKDDFIPQLLNILENHIKSDDKEKYPDTPTLSSVNMTLSTEGAQRWLAAVEEKKPFIAFRNFEQLTPFMNDAQRDKFNAVMLQIAQRQNQQTAAPSPHASPNSNHAHGQKNDAKQDESQDNNKPSSLRFGN